jgi:hypothetical protein
MDAMAIWSTEWAARLFLEAMKFWFYSISFSIILSLVLLYFSFSDATKPLKGHTGRSRKSSNGKINEKATKGSTLQWGIMKKICVDCCDIFIPGFTTGWLAVSSGTVGILGMISTVLASTDIWERVQRPS